MEVNSFISIPAFADLVGESTLNFQYLWDGTYTYLKLIVMPSVSLLITKVQLDSCGEIGGILSQALSLFMHVLICS